MGWFDKLHIRKSNILLGISRQKRSLFNNIANFSLNLFAMALVTKILLEISNLSVEIDSRIRRKYHQINDKRRHFIEETNKLRQKFLEYKYVKDYLLPYLVTPINKIIRPIFVVALPNLYQKNIAPFVSRILYSSKTDPLEGSHIENKGLEVERTSRVEKIKASIHKKKVDMLNSTAYLGFNLLAGAIIALIPIKAQELLVKFNKGKEYFVQQREILKQKLLQYRIIREYILPYLIRPINTYIMTPFFGKVSNVYRNNIIPITDRVVANTLNFLLEDIGNQKQGVLRRITSRIWNKIKQAFWTLFGCFVKKKSENEKTDENDKNMTTNSQSDLDRLITPKIKEIENVQKTTLQGGTDVLTSRSLDSSNTIRIR